MISYEIFLDYHIIRSMIYSLKFILGAFLEGFGKMIIHVFESEVHSGYSQDLVLMLIF